MPYNWQHKNWPHFEYDVASFDEQVLHFIMKAGELKGSLAVMPTDQSKEIIAQVLLDEAMKTAEIEGEVMKRLDVMSSIRKNLGLAVAKEAKDKKAIGLSNMLFEVRKTYSDTLTTAHLFKWHEMLMGNHKHISAGVWRSDDAPMQIISGSVSKPIVHFEAPPSKSVAKEMDKFIKWYNKQTSLTSTPPPIIAAIAHLYFESIHPFEDGNGRIGRAIAEKALSQGLNAPLTFSISHAIEYRRSEYYKELGKAQQTLQINEWIKWFIAMLIEAQQQSEKMIQLTIKKTRFFEQYGVLLNERQRKVINRMLEEIPENFEGGMNAKKYISLTGTSKATATRDLQELVELNIFTPVGGGRSTRYELKF